MIKSYGIYKEKKISTKRLEQYLAKYGLEKSKKPDLIIATGGDGTFLRASERFANRIVLYVRAGTNFGLLAHASLEDAKVIARKIAEGQYKIRKEPIILAEIGKREYKTAGDFYVERGRENSALRYAAKIKQNRKTIAIDAVSNGFIVTTPMGSTGYFSYVERLLGKPVKRIEGFGFEHILPHSIIENVNGKKAKAKIRHIIKGDFEINVKLKRGIDQCLFSASFISKCVRLPRGANLKFKNRGFSSVMELNSEGG
ncbi:MAG: NAD(+)/NADH kinase [Candidatus Micrarchaeia archaeon]